VNLELFDRPITCDEPRRSQALTNHRAEGCLHHYLRLLIRSYADSYNDQRSLILPLTDQEIVEILEKKKLGALHHEDKIMSDKARPSYEYLAAFDTDKP
jgi:hypothetical protein